MADEKKHQEQVQEIPLPHPVAKGPEAPNFEKVEQADCTHTGYYIPVGHDSFPLSNGDAVLVSFTIICMRCGKLWPHAQVVQTPLAAMNQDQKVKDKIIKV